jgi:hypothetical protein
MMTHAQTPAKPWLIVTLCAALTLLLLPSVACQDDTPEDATDSDTSSPKTVSAQCDGLAPFGLPDSPLPQQGQVGQWRRIWWQPRFGGADGCRVVVFDDLPIDAKIGFAPWGNVWAGGLGVQVVRGAESWGLQGVSSGGTLRVLHLEEGLLDVAFDSDAIDAQTGAQTRVTGAALGCDYGARADCPDLTDGALTKRLSVSLPQGSDRVIDPSRSYASTCRAVIDPTTQGLWVELEAGVINGVNVGRWTDQCRTTRGFPNRFTFQTGGVSGPGDFGPFTTRDLPPSPQAPNGATLPALSITLPATYFGGFRACGDLIDQDITLTSVPNITTCTYALTERPDRFTLSCDGVSASDPGSPNGGALGSLHLEADCDIEIR